MISAVLIDDEQHCTDLLAIKIQNVAPSVKIASQFNNALDALEYLRNNDVDLVFLDIEMPHMNGFELLRNLPNHQFSVIFTTAYDQYAIQAIRHSALDYLLKPVLEEELIAAIQAYTEQSGDQNKKMNLLFENLQSTDLQQNKIALPTAAGFDIVKIGDILRCMSDNNYTHFYLTDDRHFIVSRTLKEVELSLSGCGFLRIHHSHFINCKFVEKVLRTDGGVVVMKGGVELPINKQKRDELLEFLVTIRRI
jgi:two-component system LytT family response regulator